MTRIRLPPIGFFSYARQNDELSGQKLSRLRALITAELQQQYGRAPVTLFQDVTTIPYGADWERQIRDALDQSTFFVPIITPNFIQSKWCCTETDIFLKRERQLFERHPDLHQKSRIFPIDYRKIRDGDLLSPTILAVLRQRLWFDFQDLRDRDPAGETVSRAIGSFAESICDLLLTEVELPPTPEEPVRGKAEAKAEAERRRADEASEPSQVEATSTAQPTRGGKDRNGKSPERERRLAKHLPTEAGAGREGSRRTWAHAMAILRGVDLSRAIIALVAVTLVAAAIALGLGAWPPAVNELVNAADPARDTSRAEAAANAVEVAAAMKTVANAADDSSTMAPAQSDRPSEKTSGREIPKGARAGVAPSSIRSAPETRSGREIPEGARAGVTPADTGTVSATIQLGAFPSSATAEVAWVGLSRRFRYLLPLSHEITPLRRVYVDQRPSQTVYRLRARGTGAAEICRRLRVAGEACTSVN